MRITVLALVSFLTTSLNAAQNPPLIAVAPPTPSVLGPKTVSPAHLACTDLPVLTEPMSPLRILSPHAGDRHELSYRDDVVVLNGGTPQGFVAGQRYFTRRFETPRNGAVMSPKDRGSVRTTGWLTVMAADDHSALARIDHACDGIAAGDYLDPYLEPVLPTVVAAAGSSQFTDLGRVLSGVDQREAFGAGDILSVDRGASRGYTKGMRLAFYRDRRNGTPLVELASGIVLEVGGETSKVVLERARMAVTAGDYVAVQTPE